MITENILMIHLKISAYTAYTGYIGKLEEDMFSEICFDKLSIAKLKQGSNSVNIGDRIKVLAFCTSDVGPLSSCIEFY